MISFVSEHHPGLGSFSFSSSLRFPFEREKIKKVGEWNALTWRPIPKGKTPGFNTKISKRAWVEPASPLKERPVPFINQTGKFSSGILGYWRTTDQAYVASIVSTVYQRLKMLSTHRYPKEKSNRSLGLAYQAACYYSLTRNDWFLDRVVALLARNDKALRSLLWKVVSRLGANTRFVFGQFLHQDLWLKSRAAKPRAKPSYSDLARVDPFIRRRPSPRIECASEEWQRVANLLSTVFPNICRSEGSTPPPTHP